MLYKVVLTFAFADEIRICEIKLLKVSEQYFSVVLFVMLYKVVLTLNQRY